jgi:hypothetical protein
MYQMLSQFFYGSTLPITKHVYNKNKITNPVSIYIYMKNYSILIIILTFCAKKMKFCANK